MWEFLAGIIFCHYLIDLVSSDTTMACFFFSDHWNPFWGFRFNKIDPYYRTRTVRHHAEIECFLFPFVYLIVCLCLTSLQQLRPYRDGETA